MFCPYVIFNGCDTVLIAGFVVDGFVFVIEI